MRANAGKSKDAIAFPDLYPSRPRLRTTSPSAVPIPSMFLREKLLRRPLPTRRISKRNQVRPNYDFRVKFDSVRNETGNRKEPKG